MYIKGSHQLFEQYKQLIVFFLKNVMDRMKAVKRLRFEGGRDVGAILVTHTHINMHYQLNRAYLISLPPHPPAEHNSPHFKVYSCIVLS